MTGTRLAVLPNWLGDLVMAEPALRAWRAHHDLVAIIAPGLADLVRDAGLADAVEVFDRRGRDTGMRGLWRRGRELAAYGADEVLVLGPSWRAAVLAWGTGAGRRIGVPGAGRELLLTELGRRVAVDRSVHLSDTWAALVSGRPSSDSTPAVPRWRVGALGRSGWIRLRSEFPSLNATRFAVYAAGATYGPAKQWDAKHFTQLAQIVHEQRGLLPVFVGSGSDGERALAESLARATGGTSLAGCTDLPTLAAVLEAATLCVANDSGPMHLAAALGTPTVGIFGSTSPAWTAPRGPLVRTVGPAPVPCSPCFLRECPYARECLTGIRPGSVREVVDELLGAARHGAIAGGGEERHA